MFQVLHHREGTLLTIQYFIAILTGLDPIHYIERIPLQDSLDYSFCLFQIIYKLALISRPDGKSSTICKDTVITIICIILKYISDLDLPGLNIHDLILLIKIRG